MIMQTNVMRGFYFQYLACLSLSTVLFISCGSAQPANSSRTATQRPSSGEIGDFILKDIDGKSHALSEYLGEKVIVLSFWATWCEPCKKEMAKLQELYENHIQNGLVVLAVSMDEPESLGDVRPFVKQRRFTFPVLLDSESEVTDRFNPRRSAPYNLIINRDQTIVWSHEGYVPGDEQRLEAAVIEAMENQSP